MVDDLCELDLRTGRDLDVEEALNHPRENPEKVFYAICKLVVDSDGVKAFNTKEVEQEAFGDSIMDRKGKVNPVEHVGSILSGSKPADSSEAVFSRWSNIIDHRDIAGHSYQHYTISPEFYDEIKSILENIRSKS